MKNKIKTIHKKIFNRWQSLLIRLSSNSNRPLNLPTSIIFDITPNCILKCKHCDFWKSAPSKQLTQKEAQIIIDKLYSWLGSYYLFLTGGEPLINKHLPDIIKYAYSRDVLCHLNTNGFLLTEDLIKKLSESNLYAMSISLDGATSKVHDSIRGQKGVFAQIKKALANLKNTSIKVFFNTVIMSDNVLDLKKLVQLTQKNNLVGINFQCLVSNPGIKNNSPEMDHDPLWPSKKQVKTMIQKIIDQPKIMNSKTDLENIIAYYQNPKTMSQKPCAAGINNFIIDQHGDVRLCFRFPPIGNIFQKNPKDIWLSKKAQTQRFKLRNCQRYCKIIRCNQPNNTRPNL